MGLSNNLTSTTNTNPCPDGTGLQVWFIAEWFIIVTRDNYVSKPALWLYARMRSEGYSSWVCLCVCLSVCLLSHISPTERLFVLKTLSRTQRATKVKKFVGIFLKRLCSRVMPQNMSEKANMLIIPTYPMSAFSA